MQTKLSNNFLGLRVQRRSVANKFNHIQSPSSALHLCNKRLWTLTARALLRAPRRLITGQPSVPSVRAATTKAKIAKLPRRFMRQMHMNPAEAVAAHLDLCARQSVGMHFGMFQLSAEAIDQRPSDLKIALTEAGVPDTDFTTLAEGEARIYRR